MEWSYSVYNTNFLSLFKHCFQFIKCDYFIHYYVATRLRKKTLSLFSSVLPLFLNTINNKLSQTDDEFCIPVISADAINDVPQHPSPSGPAPSSTEPRNIPSLPPFTPSYGPVPTTSSTSSQTLPTKPNKNNKSSIPLIGGLSAAGVVSIVVASAIVFFCYMKR